MVPNRSYTTTRDIIANRPTTALSVAQVSNLFAALNHAKNIGLPLNRFITIHWEKAGVPDHAAVKAIGQFLKRLNDWLTKKKRPSAYIWVRENGENKGSHVHIIAHIPPDCVRRLTTMQMRWIRQISGKPYLAKTILSRPVGFGLYAPQNAPQGFYANLDHVAAYILKGASNDAATACDLERLEAGGRVIGKRCGTSENLGSKARLYSEPGHVD